MRTGVRQATPFDVVQPGISPAALITCVGVTNVFVATNAPGYGPVSWSPSGALSGNARTNRVVFASGGSFTVTATYGGCDVQASVTAVAVNTLTADSTDLCRSGTVIYTATTTPAGYENYLSWGGEASVEAEPSAPIASVVSLKIVTELWLMPHSAACHARHHTLN